MSVRVSPLRIGAKVCFEDRWQGRVAGFDVAEDWEVLNITVATGLLFFQKSAKLPFSAVTRWGDDGVFLNVISFHAFNRQVPPVAAPSRPLSEETPVAPPGARLAGLLVRDVDRRAQAVLISRGRQVLRISTSDVQFDGKTLSLSQQVENLREYRADTALLDGVHGSLRENQIIPPEERRTLRVEVDDGVVTLEGNTRTGLSGEMAEQVVRSARGVMDVRNLIVNDIELEIELGLMLDRTGLDHRAEIHGRANLGEVTLFGYAPSQEAIDEIVRAVSLVRGVRRVISRMQVAAGGRAPVGA